MKLTKLFNDVWEDSDSFFGDRSLIGNSFLRPILFSDVETRSNEDGSKYVEFELAGHKKENVSATLSKERLLKVSAKTGEREAKYSYTLPYGTDLKNISAKFEDGLLTITFSQEKTKNSDGTIKIC